MYSDVLVRAEILKTDKPQFAYNVRIMASTNGGQSYFYSGLSKLFDDEAAAQSFAGKVNDLI